MEQYPRNCSHGFQYLFDRSKYTASRAADSQRRCDELEQIASESATANARLKSALKSQVDENKALKSRVRDIEKALLAKIERPALDSALNGLKKEVDDIHKCLLEVVRSDAKKIAKEVERCRNGSVALTEALESVKAAIESVMTKRQIRHMRSARASS